MTEKIKNIIAEYIKIPAGQLHSDTLIGRSAVGNSIILHRMYAAIAKEGFDIPGYQQITTYGDLLNKMNGTSHTANILSYKEEIIKSSVNISDRVSGIGIDIEDISKMPVAIDFREDPFYTMNFASAEIAYCIIQPDPYSSFAGLFAVKEAIVKADNNYKNTNYNKIFIDHSQIGKPFFNGFNISISHSQNFAIAVALKDIVNNNIGPANSNNNISFPVGKKTSNLISVIAIIIATIAICVSIFKYVSI